MRSSGQGLQIGKWAQAMLFAFIALLLAFTMAPTTQLAYADDQGKEVGASLSIQADDPIDLSTLTYKKFDGETYPYTGEDIQPMTPTFRDASGNKLVPQPELGTDYTLTITCGGETVSAMRELGDYQLTLTGIGASYTGTATASVSVVPYFTVYVRDADGDPQVAKAFTEDEFKKLATDGREPVSAIYGSNVASTAYYATLDDVLAEAGLAGEWKAGASVSYVDGSESYTYEQLQQARFYPGYDGTGSVDTTADSKAAPFVFALTESSSAIPEGGTAQDAENANLAAANGKNAPRAILGYIADGVAKNAGHRLWSSLTSVTLAKAKAEPSSEPDPSSSSTSGSESSSSSSSSSSGSATASTMAAAAAQTISAKNVSKTFGDKPFSLNAKAKTKLSYKSLNTKVVTVDASGKVTIKKAGTAKIQITAAKSSAYKAASKTITVKVAKAKNKLTAKAAGKTVAIKAGKSVKVAKAIKVGNKSKSKLTYVKKSGSKKIAVNKTTGKITVKKGLKKGTCTVKITVKAGATANYKAASKTVTLKVKVS